MISALSVVKKLFFPNSRTKEIRLFIQPFESEISKIPVNYFIFYADGEIGGQAIRFISTTICDKFPEQVTIAIR